MPYQHHTSVLRGSVCLACAACVTALGTLLVACTGAAPGPTLDADAAPADAGAASVDSDVASADAWRVDASEADTSHIATSPQFMLIAPGVINGPAPAGDADFDTLARLGVRTILSVDGARTDVERARARGMAYAHVPVGYDGIDDAQGAAIARVFREAPRPIYVHCHHGKHRGPAAAAVGLIATNAMTPDAGRVLLETAGTSPSYPGLFACVAEAAPMSPEALDTAPVAPSQATIEGFIAAMAHVDRVWDRVKLIRAAGWRTPAEHPDLVPAAEAGMLHDGLRASRDTAPAWDAVASAPAFVAPMLRSLEASKALEDSLVRADPDGAESAFAVLAASCRECHEVYRNQPGR